MMRLPKLLFYILVLFSSISCTQYAYFQSPLHTNTLGYREQPLKSENRPFALYANAAVATGNANEDLRDQQTAFIGAFHAAHQFGNFQAYYGSQLTLGGYNLLPYAPQIGTPTYFNSNLDETLINPHAGKNSFGALGFSGGINYVIPFQKGGEWRAFGLEANWNNQWGEYQDFRSELSSSAANLIDPSKKFATVAFTSDIIAKLNAGSIGYKFALGFRTGELTKYDRSGLPSKVLPGFFSNTLHYSYDRYAAYTQLNWGYSALSFHFGLSYRLR